MKRLLSFFIPLSSLLCIFAHSAQKNIDSIEPQKKSNIFMAEIGDDLEENSIPMTSITPTGDCQGKEIDMQEDENDLDDMKDNDLDDMNNDLDDMKDVDDISSDMPSNMPSDFDDGY